MSFRKTGTDASRHLLPTQSRIITKGRDKMQGSSFVPRERVWVSCSVALDRAVVHSVSADAIVRSSTVRNDHHRRSPWPSMEVAISGGQRHSILLSRSSRPFIPPLHPDRAVETGRRRRKRLFGAVSFCPSAVDGPSSAALRAASFHFRAVLQRSRGISD